MSGQEFQLLLYCARSQPDPECVRNLVHKGINWDKLLALAEHHGVRPMLRQSLKAVSWYSVPQSTQFELEQFYRSQVHRSLSFSGELLRLVGEFQKNYIQVAVFKGVVLLCGRMVPTLAHDDLALYLAAHGTKEGWRYLKWVCDFGEFFRKYQNLSWETMLDRAEQSHSSRPLQLRRHSCVKIIRCTHLRN